MQLNFVCFFDGVSAVLAVFVHVKQSILISRIGFSVIAFLFCICIPEYYVVTFS